MTDVTDTDRLHSLVDQLNVVVEKFNPDNYAATAPTGDYAEGMMEGTRQVCLYVSDLLHQFDLLDSADSEEEEHETV
jgi:hypothetical protein